MVCQSRLACQAATNPGIVQLGRENEAAQLETYAKEHKGGKDEKRELHETARSLWEEVNGKPGDALYAGEFDQ
jgi:hypothetical protein